MKTYIFMVQNYGEEEQTTNKQYIFVKKYIKTLTIQKYFNKDIQY